MPELKLPEVFDQRAAQTIALQLIGYIGQAVVIDASAIRRLGGVGVEMLISAQRQWQNDNADFEIKDWSIDAREALTRLGCDPELFDVEIKA